MLLEKEPEINLLPELPVEAHFGCVWPLGDGRDSQLQLTQMSEWTSGLAFNTTLLFHFESYLNYFSVHISKIGVFITLLTDELSLYSSALNQGW